MYGLAGLASSLLITEDALSADLGVEQETRRASNGHFILDPLYVHGELFAKFMNGVFYIG